MPNGCNGVQWITRWYKPVDECCNWHDLAYAASGIPRAVADEAFYYCLQTINPVTATLGFAAVSVFGWLFYRKKHLGTGQKAVREWQLATLTFGARVASTMDDFTTNTFAVAAI